MTPWPLCLSPQLCAVTALVPSPAARLPRIPIPWSNPAFPSPSMMLGDVHHLLPIPQSWQSPQKAEELVGSSRGGSLSLQAAAVPVRRKASCCITLQKKQQLPQGVGCLHPSQSYPSPDPCRGASPQHKGSLITQSIHSCICRTAKIVPNATDLLHSLGYQHCAGRSKPCCRVGGSQAMGLGSCSPEDGLCFLSQKERSWRGVLAAAT